MPAPSVIIVEDAALLREGVERLLTDAGLSVLATAGDAEGLMATIDELSPSVVLLDVRMPPTHTTEGLEAALEIRRTRPHVGVLVLSQYLEPKYAIQLLEDSPNGVGYLLKDRVADGSALVRAITRISKGESVIDPEVVDRLLGKARHESPIENLTTREREILRLMAEGRTNPDIAAELFSAIRTVESHIRSIFSKLEIHGEDGHKRVLAVLAWLRGN